MVRVFRFAPRAVASSVLIALVGCGGGSKTPVTPPSTAPPPTTTPVTLATPEPPPGALSCGRIGNGLSSGYQCRTESPTFMGDLDQALDELIGEQPALFENVSNGLRVTSTGQFYVSLIQKLDKKGLCSGFDGEELQVKSNNTFNDQYHMITSALLLRRGPSSYMATCYPAAFPTPLPPYIPAGTCPLAPSREITCGRDNSLYLDLVHGAVDDVARSHPEVFDVKDQKGQTGGYKILDAAKFVQYTLDALRSRGFCARHDGEEFVVKKENKFSEHYDLELAEGYVRRGLGTYTTSCYPAAF